MKKLFTCAVINNTKVWIGLFIGIQLVVAVSKIVSTYKEDLVLFHNFTWNNLFEPATGRSILFFTVLVFLSFWAAPFLKRKDYSFSAAWGYGCLLVVSLLSLANYAVMYVTGHFYQPVNWIVFGAIAAAGFGNRAVLKDRYLEIKQFLRTFRRPGCSAWIALALGISVIPYIVLPFHFFDTTVFWAPKAFAISSSGNANALLLEPHSSYPPLYPIILSLSMGDRLFQGRLIPILMFFAFLAVFRRAVSPGKNIGVASALVLLIATMQVWLGTVNFYADVPLMILLGAAGLLLISAGKATGIEKTGIEIGAAAVLLCSAVLIRPDGLFSVSVLLTGIFFAEKKKRIPRYVVLGVIALAAALTWQLRPSFLRGDPDFFKKVGSAQLLAWGGGLHFHTIVNFFYAAQGLILSHYGFGAFFYGLIVAVIVAQRRKRVFMQEYRAFAILSFLSLLALAGMYLFIGLLLNFAMNYPFMVRVSFGRMMVHFFPFMLLYFVYLANYSGSEMAPSSREPRRLSDR